MNLYKEKGFFMCKAMESLKINSSFKSKFGTDGVAFSKAALSEFHLLKATAKQGLGRNGL